MVKISVKWIRWAKIEELINFSSCVLSYTLVALQQGNVSVKMNETFEILYTFLKNEMK